MVVWGYRQVVHLLSLVGWGMWPQLDAIVNIGQTMPTWPKFYGGINSMCNRAVEIIMAHMNGIILIEVLRRSENMMSRIT